MKFNYLILSFYFCIFSVVSLHATLIPEIDATEITLKNGIKVCLKPIANSEDIQLRGVAPGGYSVLPQNQQASGKLSAAIAWGSGFGPWGNTEIGNKLLQDSLELETQVGPFTRSIEASTSPSRVEELFQLIHALYTQPRFDQAVLPKVIDQLRESVQLRHKDPETLFEDVIRSVNTSDLAILHPITADDLKHVDFETSKNFYMRHFLSTEELTFLIVGDVSLEKVIPLVNKYLGAIPQLNQPPETDTTHRTTLPTGITKREVTSPYLQECMARITFPLAVDLDEQQWQQLEITSQVIETRLRRRFREVMGSTQGIDVAYELPYYPHRNPAWLTIQFRCANSQADKITNLILTDLAQLGSNGPLKEEVEKVRSLHACNDEFWLQHKKYWTNMLANYYLWGWNVRNIIKDYDSLKAYQPELVQRFVKQYLLTDRYTLVLLKPR